GARKGVQRLVKGMREVGVKAGGHARQLTVKTADGADELRQFVRAQDNKRHKQHDRQLLAAEVEHTTSLNSDGRPLAAATHRPLVEAWQGDFAASALLPPGPDPAGAVTTPTAPNPNPRSPLFQGRAGRHALCGTGTTESHRFSRPQPRLRVRRHRGAFRARPAQRAATRP